MVAVNSLAECGQNGFVFVLLYNFFDRVVV